MSLTVPTTYAEWQEALDLAQEYQDREGRLDRWAQIRDFYLNDYPEGVVSVNLLFAIGRAMVPVLYFKAPSIRVTPRPTSGMERLQDRRRKARILQAVDEWLIPSMGLKQQVKLQILDAYRFNVGIGKCGYQTLGSEPPRSTAQVDRAVVAEQLQQIEDAFGPALATDLETAQQEALPDAAYQYHDLLQPDSPWYLRVPPEDFLVPWGTSDIAAAPWCAFRVVRPLDDLKADPRYRGMRDFTPNSSGLPINYERPRVGIMRPMRKGSVMGGEDSRGLEFLEFYEVWDKRTGRVMAVVPDQGDDFPRNETHNLGIRGLPVNLLQFNPDGEDFWGTSDAEHILPQVIEFNESRTQEMVHRRLSNLKVIVDKNKMSPEEQQRMASAQAGVSAQTDGPPGDAVLLVTPPVNRELYNVSEAIRTDIREVVGWSRNSMAQFESERRTATEAKIVQGNLELRADERRDQVGDLIGEVFKWKINRMITTHWSTERVIQVTGEEDWTPYRGTDLAGEYDVEVLAESTLPLGRMEAKQQAGEVFVALRNDPRIDQDVLYRWFLGHFPEAPRDELLRTPAEMEVLRAEAMGQGNPAMDLGQMLAQARQSGQAPQNGGQPAMMPGRG